MIERIRRAYSDDVTIIERTGGVYVQDARGYATVLGIAFSTRSILSASGDYTDGHFRIVVAENPEGIDSTMFRFKDVDESSLRFLSHQYASLADAQNAMWELQSLMNVGVACYVAAEQKAQERREEVDRIAKGLSI